MKTKLLCAIVLLAASITSNAQVPQAINYQAVARDNFGAILPNQLVALRLSVLDGSGGPTLYSERDTVTTNQFGLFTVKLGMGQVLSGTFSAIPWGSSSPYLKTEMDPTGGFAYMIMGESQLISVPYALYAATTPSNLNGTLNYVVKFTPDGFHGGNSQIFDDANNIGVATALPMGKFHIKGTADSTQLIIDANAVQSNTHPLIRLRNSGGSDLMHISSDGSTNTFVGLNTGRANIYNFNTSGTYNTFIGSDAGSNNTSGRYNTALGTEALNSNSTGSANTAIGAHTLSLSTTVGSNTAVGYGTLHNNTSGFMNSAVGANALTSNTIGIINIAIGVSAMVNNTTASGNIAIGNSAMYTQSFSNGNSQYGPENMAIGVEALYYNQPTSTTDGNKNTALGHRTLYRNNTGSSNTAVGWHTLGGSAGNVTGSENTAVGSMALASDSAGSYNTAIGNQALYNNDNGSYNTGIGRWALYATHGDYNSGLGSFALYYNQYGSNNIGIGPYCGPCFGFSNLNNTIVIAGSATCTQNSNYAMFGNASTTWNGGNVTWSTFSDGRIKKNVTEDVAGLQFIMRLRPVTYNKSVQQHYATAGQEEPKDYPEKYDVEQIRFSGFIAQEVESAAKETGYDFSGIVAPKSSGDLYSLRYAEFVVPLVKGIQEQQQQIEELQKQIELLKQTVVTLQAKQ